MSSNRAELEKPRLKILRLVRVFVPVILLTIVFLNIDLERLAESLLKVNLALLAAALLVGYFSQIFMGAWRWQFILARFYGIRISYVSLLRYLWVGMFVGYFVPANLGMDVYRVLNATKHGGGYKKNITAVLGEKVVVMIGSVLVLIACYPLVRPAIVTNVEISQTVHYVCLVGALAVVAIAMFVTLLATRASRQVRGCLQRKFNATISGIAAKTGHANGKNHDAASPVSLLLPFLQWQNLLGVIVFTVVTRVISGIGANILFLSLAQQLPIVVNVFATTLLIIIFMLPVSVGSLGVREGSFIVLFGLFGVERETALAASFLGLACLLLTACCGGVILLISNMRENSR